MTQGQKAMVCLLVAVLAVTRLAGAATAEAGNNPYQVIAEKNVFRLKPPPPPPSEEPPKLPTPKITLTGITTFGKKRAMLKTPPPPVKPGEQPKGEQFYTLAVGERDGEMEMLEIDEVGGAVKVRYAGNEVPLNFVDNGAKPSAAPALPMPGQPGQPGGFVPPPPTGFPSAQPTVPGVKPLPTRTLRLPTPAGGTPGYNPNPAYNQTAVGGYVPPVGGVQVATPGAGNQTLPSFTFNRGASGPTTDQAAPPPPPATPEEQVIILKAQEEMNQGTLFPPVPDVLQSQPPVQQQPFQPPPGLQRPPNAPRPF